MSEENQEKKTHKCLILSTLITSSELIVNSTNSPLGTSAKFTEVQKGTELELEKNEAIRLEKMGTVEILDKPIIPSPEEVEAKEQSNRLENIIQAKFEAMVKPLQDQIEALKEENAKLKEEKPKK